MNRTKYKECTEKQRKAYNKLIKTELKKQSRYKPSVIIVNTIKRKGIKEFEDDPVWHARKIQGEDIKIGKKELGIE